jgi:DNA polymerase-1
MESYFSRFDKVREYLKGVVEKARQDGYTQTMFGRRRYLPDLVSDNRVIRQAAERMALNAPIQGTAADIIKLAMIQLESELEKLGTKSRLILQVHDELVLEVIESEREYVEEVVKIAMMSAADLKVPLSVSVGYGKDWDTAAH